MSFKLTLRGSIYHAKGRVEYNGKPITGYIRESTGSSTEAGGWQWIEQRKEWEIRRYLFGEEEAELRVSDAILHYQANPATARKLERLLEAHPDITELPLSRVSGRYLKNLALKLHPTLSTDTCWSYVVAPIQSVVNNMHELNMGPYLRVKAYTAAERIKRDTERGKLSRQKKNAANAAWINAFCKSADCYNAALVHFMWETASRIDQAVNVRPPDLDPEGCRVWLKAQKGHPAQWVDVSRGLMDELVQLPPKRPKNRKTNKLLDERVFGYGSKGGYRKAWRRICIAADIPYLTAHEAGRHGFATELMIRQGLDPVTVAAHGRWASPRLLFENYGHAETSGPEIRELLRTKPEH